MKNFVFPLKRTMEWREHRAEVEKTELERLHGVRSQIAQSRTEVRMELEDLGRGAHSRGTMTAEQLHQMAMFTQSLHNLDRHLKGEEGRCEQQIVQQRDRCIRADRDHKLLTQLHDGRHQEWKAGIEREIEQTATEVWNSGRTRELNRSR